MNPIRAFAIVIASGLLVCHASPHFSATIISGQTGDNVVEVGFYSPEGDLAITTLSGDFLWDGLSLKANTSGLTKVNESGDGFGNLVSGWAMEHELYTASIFVGGNRYTFQRHPEASTFAYAINKNSQVVGAARGSPSSEAFLWADGEAIYLNELINGDLRPEAAVAISDEGIIFGTRHLPNGAKGFITLKPDGSGRYNATEITGFPSQDLRVSRNGHVASGSALWDGNQTIDMGDLGRPGRVWPQSVNARGQVTGMAKVPDDNTMHGFFWNGRILDLNKAVSLPSGWIITSGEDINDYGQIAATVFGDGQHHAVLLTPDPQIASVQRLSMQLATVKFHAGSTEPVRLEASADLIYWEEISNEELPSHTSIVSFDSTLDRQFFRVIRPKVEQP